jgi:hypothetical protein
LQPQCNVAWPIVMIDLGSVYKPFNHGVSLKAVSMNSSN